MIPVLGAKKKKSLLHVTGQRKISFGEGGKLSTVPMDSDEQIKRMLPDQTTRPKATLQPLPHLLHGFPYNPMWLTLTHDPRSQSTTTTGALGNFVTPLTLLANRVIPTREMLIGWLQLKLGLVWKQTLKLCNEFVFYANSIKLRNKTELNQGYWHLIDLLQTAKNSLLFVMLPKLVLSNPSGSNSEGASNVDLSADDSSQWRPFVERKWQTDAFSMSAFFPPQSMGDFVFVLDATWVLHMKPIIFEAPQPFEPNAMPGATPATPPNRYRVYDNDELNYIAKIDVSQLPKREQMRMLWGNTSALFAYRVRQFLLPCKSDSNNFDDASQYHSFKIHGLPNKQDMSDEESLQQILNQLRRIVKSVSIGEAAKKHAWLLEGEIEFSSSKPVAAALGSVTADVSSSGASNNNNQDAHKEREQLPQQQQLSPQQEDYRVEAYNSLPPQSTSSDNVNAMCVDISSPQTNDDWHEAQQSPRQSATEEHEGVHVQEQQAQTTSMSYEAMLESMPLYSNFDSLPTTTSTGQRCYNQDALFDYDDTHHEQQMAIVDALLENSNDGFSHRQQRHHQQQQQQQQTSWYDSYASMIIHQSWANGVADDSLMYNNSCVEDSFCPVTNPDGEIISSSFDSYAPHQTRAAASTSSSSTTMAPSIFSVPLDPTEAFMSDSSALTKTSDSIRSSTQSLGAYTPTTTSAIHQESIIPTSKHNNDTDSTVPFHSAVFYASMADLLKIWYLVDYVRNEKKICSTEMSALIPQIVVEQDLVSVRAIGVFIADYEQLTSFLPGQLSTFERFAVENADNNEAQQYMRLYNYGTGQCEIWPVPRTSDSKWTQHFSLGLTPEPLKSYLLDYYWNRAITHNSLDDIEWLGRMKQRKESYHKSSPITGVQHEQILDAFYWLHLAPKKRPEYAAILHFYENAGIQVKLKNAYTRTGAHSGRCSSSGRTRNYAPHRKHAYSAPSAFIQPVMITKKKSTGSNESMEVDANNNNSETTTTTATIERVALKRNPRQTKSRYCGVLRQADQTPFAYRAHGIVDEKNRVLYERPIDHQEYLMKSVHHRNKKIDEVVHQKRSSSSNASASMTPAGFSRSNAILIDSKSVGTNNSSPTTGTTSTATTPLTPKTPICAVEYALFSDIVTSPSEFDDIYPSSCAATTDVAVVETNASGSPIEAPIVLATTPHTPASPTLQHPLPDVPSNLGTNASALKWVGKSHASKKRPFHDMMHGATASTLVGLKASTHLLHQNVTPLELFDMTDEGASLTDLSSSNNNININPSSSKSSCLSSLVQLSSSAKRPLSSESHDISFAPS